MASCSPTADSQLDPLPCAMAATSGSAAAIATPASRQQRMGRGPVMLKWLHAQLLTGMRCLFLVEPGDAAEPHRETRWQLAHPLPRQIAGHLQAI